MSPTANRWWETRWFALLAIVASTIPLLVPAIPPLADLPGHIGRYHIAANIAHSPDLARHWQFEWGVVGNLGVDLLVQLLSPLLPAEQAAKLVVLLIPPLWVSGLIRVSCAGGEKLSPAAAFAFPLAYGFPFQFGFVNFMLAVALALHALAWWIALGRSGRLVLRAALFAPIACLLWVAHSFGWGMFGLLAFAAEMVRLRQRGGRWRDAAMGAALQCLALTLPLALMLASGAGAAPGAAWDWRAKAAALASLLRERWKWYDVASAVLLLVVAWMGLRDSRFRLDPIPAACALLCLLAFLALPRLLLGGAYVDMRMLAPALAFALIAIRVRPENPRLERLLAGAGAAFLLVRTIGSTLAMLLFAETQQTALAAVPHLPRGAAVLVLVNEPCTSAWSSDRLSHVAGIGVARADLFENGQWTLGGQQLLRPRHPQAAPWLADPSQLVYPVGCEYRASDFDAAIRDFDRGTFTYVWTLGFPAQPRLAPDVALLWSNSVSAVYRVR